MKTRLSSPFLFSLATMLLSAVAAFAGIDAPHDAGHNISCASCHDTSLPDSPLLTGSNINNFCTTNCHNAVAAPYTNTSAPKVAGHTSGNTSEQYGTWDKQCTDCHNPHIHEQKYWKNSDGDTLFLAQGQIDDFVYNGDNTSTLTYSGATFKGDWTFDTITVKTTAERRSILMPNIKKIGNTFSIVAMDATSITVAGDVSALYTYINPPTDFGIIFGQFLSNYIDTDGDGSFESAVKTMDKSGAKSFAYDESEDGTDETPDGICQVCHTNTSFWTNDGALADHYSGWNCTNQCHPHSNGFKHGGDIDECIQCHGHDTGTNYDADMAAPYTAGGLVSQGTGSYKSHSTHTETDSDDLFGPGIYCDSCHDITNFPSFKSGTDGNADGKYDLSETDVCDTCHSPGGTYDGVDDATVGAKVNWFDGIYTGSALQSGKEKWCATCHDEDPSVIQAIAAPNVVGDADGAYTYGTGWGFYTTGHGLDAATTYPASGGLSIGAGKECDDCHDYSIAHIDGDIRTYSSGSDNYQAGYRLKSIDGGEPMNIPNTSDYDLDPDDYALCFSCHDSNRYLLTTPDPVITGFRDDEDLAPDGGDVPLNAHMYHLDMNGIRFDSDWNGTYDSIIACVNCHNVHGSTQLSMVRDGKLVGKEPGLVVYYDNVLTSPDEIYSLSAPDPADVTLAASTGTSFLGVSTGNICSPCHGGNYIKYYRSPPSAPAAPTLAWTGETGYETDGVIPDNAQSGSYFAFRVEYTDVNYDLPATIQVWVDADDSGSYEDGEKFDLFEVDSSDDDTTDGKLYSKTMVVNFAGDGTLNYRFHAADRSGEATGDPVTGGTITLTASTPVLAWSGAEGYIADGVNPNSGAAGSSYVFRIDYSHADNTPPTNIQVWVDIDDNITEVNLGLLCRTMTAESSQIDKN
ncbi:MAG: hypothetical protein KAJ55_09150 [Anaerolineales bacterium]|nr:hypothetical protein [Anaerolineales bacterium]